MKHAKSQQTLTTLANAGELAANIAQGVIGNEVADSFAGSPLTRAVIYQLAQTEFQKVVSKHVGV